MNQAGQKSVVFVIFTDLDGTLLDPDQSWHAARPALALCRRLGVEVALVSSKTRAEMEPLHRRLGLTSPFVCENGGGVYFPAGTGAPPAGARRAGAWWRLALGRPYPQVVAGLRRLRRRLGWPMLGFSDLTPAGVSALTGLTPAAARRAARREFDEPFLLPDPAGADLARLEREAGDEGLTLVAGGRFHHLHAGPGKGAALELVLAWLRRRGALGPSVGLGDAPNDFDMLSRVDLPVLVASAESHAGLERRLPGLRRTSLAGAAGFNEAVLAILGQGGPAGAGRDKRRYPV